MAILHLEVNNQILTASCDIGKIVENSIEYLEFDLKCSPDWDGFTKQVIFTYNGEDITAPDNFVPPPVLHAPGFSVSVNGLILSDETDASSGDNISSETNKKITKRITTSPIRVNVYPSGALNGTVVPEEELDSDWLTDIQNTVNSAKNIANNANTNAANAVNIANEAESIAQIAETNSQSAVNTANEAKISATTAETNSENAVNIANDVNTKVTEAIDQIPNNYANALRGYASGKTISFNDVSPIEHKVKVKINTNGKNLLNPNSALEIIGSYLGIRLLKKNFPSTLSISLKDGATVPSGVSFGMIYYSIEDTRAQALWLLENGTVKRNSCSTNQVLQNVSLENLDSIVVGIYPATQEAWDAVFNALNVQLEKGDIATDYEPYIDPTSVMVTGCGKNILGFTDTFLKTGHGLTINYDANEQIFTINSTPTEGKFSINFGSHLFDKFSLPIGTNVALSIEHISGTLSAEKDTNVFFLGNSDSPAPPANEIENWISVPLPASGRKTLVSTANKQYFTNAWVYIGKDYNVTFDNYKFKVQLEIGTEATDYKEFIGTKYTPTTNETVDVLSLAPTMTLLTNTGGVIIDCEYNRDTNKVIENLANAIISLGGNI